MGFLDFGRSSSRQVSDVKELVDYYQRLRPLRMALNHKLTARLSRDEIQEGAGKIGMLSGNHIVFGREDEGGVLMDYCIYDVYRNGRNAVEQYLCDEPPEPESDEMVILQAMRRATYTMLLILEVEKGVGCRCHDLYRDEVRLLLDVALSSCAVPGTLMTTRILDFGQYIATTGAPLPAGVLPEEEWDECVRTLRSGRAEPNADPAPLIRECLQRSEGSHVTYAEPGSAGGPKRKKELPPVENPAARKRTLVAHQASKAEPKRRCRCGSGKMYKNCCGKTARRT